MRIDEAANCVAELTRNNQTKALFRLSLATCRACRNLLEVYYCEERTYAVRCVHCETVTIIKAACFEEAAARVGVIAIPLDGWTEDDGDVIAIRFPVRDCGDVCIGNPLSIPPDIPEDFTHFISLPCPAHAMKTETGWS